MCGRGNARPGSSDAVPECQLTPAERTRVGPAVRRLPGVDGSNFAATAGNLEACVGEEVINAGA